jgi:nucleolar protein 58
MLLLMETPAGFGLFKLNNEGIIDTPDSVYDHFATAEKAQKAVSLEAFSKFKDTKAAMEAATDIIEGQVGKSLKKFLKKNIVDQGVQDKLAVFDKTLAASIKSKVGIECVWNAGALEVMRGIRFQLHELVEGLYEKETCAMTLGLSHSLARFKLKFSPDKVDTMIVQAIGLLDDIDKELNNFAMRLREWYGWHFPELAKIVSDNQVYALVVKIMGMRVNAKDCDFQGSVPEEIIDEIKKSAEISMGTDITDEDLVKIQDLCSRVIDLSKNRAALGEYLKQRMEALAPNLTSMVGELIGARLISHAGSLMNLAKAPSSTVQILGAEKALFRALKQKKETPKYGLIYHASLVGQSSAKQKGKISRVLAAKLSLCSRVDALGESNDASLGEECREYVEQRLQALESGGAVKLSKSKKASSVAKYVPPTAETKSGAATYNAEADAVDMEGIEVVKKKKKDKKEKKEKRAAEEMEAEAAAVEEPAKKKKKKKNKMPEDEQKPQMVQEAAQEILV